VRSAYGFQIPEIASELTRVGPGTPGGELLRRYWHPVCTSADLTDLPRRVRILGEDLVAFRDGQGRAGVLFFRCSHRGTSLEYGRVEERGLRCCYHGWLYDVEGNVLDMPLEPPTSTYRDRIQQPGYPVHEFAGLIFVYMGPPDRLPQFPVFDVVNSWLAGEGTLQAKMGIRTGGAYNCNWLQAQENLMDPLHLTWLHTAHSGPQFPSELYGAWPVDVVYDETEMGMKFTVTAPLPDGRREWRLTWELVMPMTTALLYSESPSLAESDGPLTERTRNILFCVPVDDTHQLGAQLRWNPAGRADYGRGALAPGSRKDVTYEYTQRHPDDKEAQEGQGEIANHGLEHLATSDRGVIMCRRILRDALRAIADGKDPKGIVRDPARARDIPTYAGSSVAFRRQEVAAGT
jgi:nitrite reductase/ring-hydroxylating ferredoxin subunit